MHQAEPEQTAAEEPHETMEKEQAVSQEPVVETIQCTEAASSEPEATVTEKKQE